MATISTHNGSAVRQAHNLRTKACVEKEPHINPDGAHETWQHETIREAYSRIFDEAVERYNRRQERADRKIKDYLSEVRADERRHDCYEMIIGVYGKEVDDDTGKQIMRDFVDSWKERNPNLDMIGAYYHADEQGKNPHVHIDYIPVAHGYRRGLDTQNGLVKALGEMGIQKNGRSTAQILWEARENNYLEKLCKERGIEIEHPQSGQKNIRHLHTQEYKAAQQVKDMEQKLAAVEQSYRTALKERDAVRVETDVRSAVNRATSDCSYKHYDFPEIIAETQEREKTLFLEHKPATVTIEKDSYKKMLRYIREMEQREGIFIWAKEAADRMERAEQKYTKAAEVLLRNQLYSREVAIDMRVKEAVEDKKEAYKYLEEKTQEAEALKEDLRLAELTLQGYERMFANYEDVLKYFPEEWQKMQDKTEHILKLEKQYDKGVHNKTVCSEYLKECAEQGLPCRKDIEKSMKLHQKREREYGLER